MVRVLIPHLKTPQPVLPYSTVESCVLWFERAIQFISILPLDQNKMSKSGGLIGVPKKEDLPKLVRAHLMFSRIL